LTTAPDAASGELHVLDPPGWQAGLPPCLPAGRYPKPRDEAIRFRAEVMAPGESFDQKGFELTPVPLPADDDSGQQELFSDRCSQPDTADGEPVFWPAGAAQALPTDDSVQPDAPE